MIKNKMIIFFLIPVLMVFMISGCSLFTDKTATDFKDSGDVVGGEVVKLIYVSTTGNDTNPGTKTSPKLTIQNAITNSISSTEVHVAQGTYTLNTSTGQITMKEGVSIMGGYSSDFSVRNITTYPTIINDTRISGSGLSTIYCSGITSATQNRRF